MGFKVEPDDEETHVELAAGQSIDTVLDYLASKSLRLRNVRETKLTLEDVFMDLVEKSERGGDRRGVRQARPVSQARRA